MIAKIRQLGDINMLVQSPSLILPSQEQLKKAADIVYQTMPPTPQISWNLLNRALDTQVWLKHENHTPAGAFKYRGGLVYLHELANRAASIKHIVTATRGNHGISIGLAAQRFGIQAHIVVPKGNSVEKNEVMRALGVDLIEFGNEFQQSREHAALLAQHHGWHSIPSMHPDLVAGVASYWLELFTAQPDLDVVFVPIGQGSGICAAAAAKHALGLRTQIIGVVSEHAPAYKLSFEAGYKIEAPTHTQLADGMACRSPDDLALSIINQTVSAIVTVTDAEVADAMRLLFKTTHNVAEGAGAAATAAALQLKTHIKGHKVGIPLCGGNVDTAQFARVLSGDIC